MRLQSKVAIALASLALAFALPVGAADEPAQPICASCHEGAHASIALTKHGAKNDAMGSMCQACHGDASKHLEDPMKNKMVNRFAHATAAEKSAVCLTCHAGNRHLAFWDSGKHRKNDVTQ